MQKYITLLLNNIHDQLDSWFDLNDVISNTEVRRFLHSVKGTAGTLRMLYLSVTAASLLNELNSLTIEDWDSQSLQDFLIPLIKATYELEQQQAPPEKSLMTLKRIPHIEQQPLVLILDDDAVLLQFLKDRLELEGFFVVATVNPNQAIRYFYDLSPDSLIIDLIIPEKDGFQVIDALKERISKGLIPTTIISTDTRKSSRIKAFDMGADDFLNKPLDMDDLLARLKRQMRKREQLGNLLFMDELTGAMNRKYLDEAFRQLCRDYQREASCFSLSVIDLDFFKQVNDHYGHLTGDQVLQQFAAFLKENIRINDILIRLGGEEFVLIMPKTDELTAKMTMESLLERFTLLDFSYANTTFHVSFSVGVTEGRAITQEECYKILEIADNALYCAKKRGRRCVEIGRSGIQQNRNLRKLNIAIIDDDAIVRTMLKQYLTEDLSSIITVHIRAFRSGEHFFRDPWHAERAPFLIILDGIMPGMDGLEVLEKIRSIPHTDLHSVIMLTGRKEENDIVRALQLGADDYLTKPFKIGELGARIRRLLTRMNFI